MIGGLEWKPHGFILEEMLNMDASPRRVKWKNIWRENAFSIELILIQQLRPIAHTQSDATLQLLFKATWKIHPIKSLLWEDTCNNTYGWLENKASAHVHLPTRSPHVGFDTNITFLWRGGWRIGWPEGGSVALWAICFWSDHKGPVILCLHPHPALFATK